MEIVLDVYKRPLDSFPWRLNKSICGNKPSDSRHLQSWGIYKKKSILMILHFSGENQVLQYVGNDGLTKSPAIDIFYGKNTQLNFNPFLWMS